MQDPFTFTPPHPIDEPKNEEAKTPPKAEPILYSPLPLRANIELTQGARVSCLCH